ncbi:MAG: neutral/alkaline non-lysosomal ceramidase N-terminal domain-containing protein [Hymenobacteraceae bacterium]|nr:neutral/alkaline non-lysosomal ceramidase N-terminal domain-containing protein [Hymenobacteraceae bacterium]
MMMLLCQACVVQRLDRTPYQETAYYRQTMEQLQQHLPTSTAGDTLQVGWAKVNITPPTGTPLAGYGKRRGMRYTSVHDSVWVRTFAFSNGTGQAYLVSLDMLIAPMTVAEALEQEYVKLGLKPEQVYLSATHTHTSFGGWGKKLAGRIMAGKYEQEVVQQTVQRIVQSVVEARADLQPARIGYGEAGAAPFVKNRLTGSSTSRDTTLRFLKFVQQDKEEAILCTFSGHATILPSMQPVLSADYPGVLVRELEKEVAFAAFAAGAVGSHQCVYAHGDSFESVEATGQGLARLILQQEEAVPLAYASQLRYARAPLWLPEPQWRVGQQKRFAPGLFYTFFGKYDSYLSSLQVGDVVLLGVPADYSGELMPPLQTQASRQGQHVLLTGFNGGYIGYLVPDEHYQLKKYEARAMNFYGPHSGSYITDLLVQLLKQHQVEQR